MRFLPRLPVRMTRSTIPVPRFTLIPSSGSDPVCARRGASGSETRAYCASAGSPAGAAAARNRRGRSAGGHGAGARAIDGARLGRESAGGRDPGADAFAAPRRRESRTGVGCVGRRTGHRSQGLRPGQGTSGPRLHLRAAGDTGGGARRFARATWRRRRRVERRRTPRSSAAPPVWARSWGVSSEARKGPRSERASAAPEGPG